MDEDVAMMADNDTEYQKHSYRKLSQCSVTSTIPYELACHGYWDTAVTGRKSIA